MLKIKDNNLFYHLGGSFVSRSLPILFGLVVSRFYGEVKYNLFISSLVISNLAITIGTMGFGAQLIVNSYLNSYKNTIFTLGVLLLLLLTTIFFYTGLFDNNSLFCILFTLGSGTGLIISSLYNGNLKFKIVFFYWIILFCFQFLVFLIFFYLKADYPLSIYAFIYFIVSFLFLFYISFIRKEVVFVLKSVDIVKSVFTNAVKLSAFSSLFLLGFSVLFKITKGESDEKAIFSLGYQLFSLAIFLPSILGSYVIPLFTAKKENSAKILNKLLVVYGSISLFLTFVLLALNRFIFGVYKIPMDDDTRKIILYMIIAGFFCSLSTAFVHLHNTNKSYSKLSLASLIWFCSLLISLFVFLYINNFKEINIYDASYSFFIAYLVYLLFYIIDRIVVLTR